MSQYQKLWDGTANPDVEFLAGDAGGNVGATGAGVINVLGNTGAYLNGIQFTGDPVNNTLSAMDLRNTTKYVVDSTAGETEYQTIQSAIDAAQATGNYCVIYVRPGTTYTENLTLYDKIAIVGGDPRFTIIQGNHTPPNSGAISFAQLTLISVIPGDIIASAAAGTTNIYFNQCVFGLDDGYILDAPNWTGTLSINNSSDGSLVNGIINNTGGATCSITNSTLGAQIGNAMNVSGITTAQNVYFRCPINIQGAATARFSNGCFFEQTVTTANTAITVVVDSTFSTGATQAITHGASGDFTLSDVTIDSTNNPCIGGAGAGDLVLGSVTYLNDTNIAGTITKSFATRLETGELKLDDSDQGTLTVNSGVVSSVQGQNVIYVGKHGNDANDGLTWGNAKLTFGAAITAGAALASAVIVCQDSGTYTENLTGQTDVDIFAPDAIIAGAHTLAGGNKWQFGGATVATGVVGFTLNSAGTTAFIRLKTLTVAGAGIGIVSLNGELFADVESATIANGFFIGSTTVDQIHFEFGEISITGTGTAIGVTTGGTVCGFGNCIVDAGNGTVFFSNAAATTKISLVCSALNMGNLSNITATTEVRLSCNICLGTLAEGGAGRVTGRSNSQALLIDPGASGDPAVRFAINQTDKFCLGVDDTDSDKFKITDGASPSAGNTIQEINSTGETIFPLQPAFLATQTTAQNNLPINSTTTITLNNEIFDQNSDYNAASYTFTSPVTGKYQFNFTLTLNQVDTASGNYYVRISTSNRIFGGWENLTENYSADPDNVTIRLNVLCDMDAADTATCSITIPNAGAAQADVRVDTGVTGTNFSGALIC